MASRQEDPWRATLWGKQFNMRRLSTKVLAKDPSSAYLICLLTVTKPRSPRLLESSTVVRSPGRMKGASVPPSSFLPFSLSFLFLSSSLFSSLSVPYHRYREASSSGASYLSTVQRFVVRGPDSVESGICLAFPVLRDCLDLLELYN